MKRLLPRLVKVIGPGIALYFLLFHGLADVAFLSADEPRYASVGRAMAQSGDWITPRLNNEPWFEKPPLLYWMTATAWRFGLRDELAARLPVALLSAAFLIFFYFRLRRDFGHAPALTSASILATSVGWVVFSNVAVTDLPLATCLSIAMLLALPPPAGTARPLPLATGLFLGLAMLAKGLVPAVLALPALYFWRAQWRRILIVAFIAAAVVLPWFLLATARNGPQPWNELILKHHFARFFGGEIHHERPFWFYVPVLLGGLLPWTPALIALRPRPNADHPWTDPRLQYLAAWAAFGFLFFSVSTNKLPGYLLPILPPLAALMGIRWAGRALNWICLAVALSLFLIARLLLPEALIGGITNMHVAGLAFQDLAIMALILLVCLLGVLFNSWRRGPLTVVQVAVATAVVLMLVKALEYEQIDNLTSGRKFYRELGKLRSDVCIETIDRDWRYSLDYYAEPRLPECETSPMSYKIVQETGMKRPDVRTNVPPKKLPSLADPR
jgi:4-amino-4-deoxy-L-arabinose transferase